MGRLASVVAALFLSGPAQALEPEDISGAFAAHGIAAVEAELAALPEPTPTQAAALGTARFLRAIEITLQTRWRHGLNAAQTELPVLRLPVANNPAPEPAGPDLVATIFSDLLDDLAGARAPLAEIEDGDAVRLPITFTDLWFDIDTNGVRERGEDLVTVAALTLTGQPMLMSDAPTATFDTADAAWLLAYTHFLAAFAELVLSIDPTTQIDRFATARDEMDALAADTNYRNAIDMQFGQQVDRAAIILSAIQGQPDPVHTRAAKSHLLEMIAANRTLWARVTAETDNEGEWIPNATQTQVLGLEVPPETGPRWLAVLDDAEALLTGAALVPHWRLREGAGINLARFLDDPAPIDPVGWMHGAALLPYSEEGRRVSPENWIFFQRMVQGDALLFVVFLN